MSKAKSPELLGSRPPLALIAGPTASGKSDLAVRLALALEKRGQRGVVVNADSAQVYADLSVLSARPSPEDMQGVDHRLVSLQGAGLRLFAGAALFPDDIGQGQRPAS